MTVFIKDKTWPGDLITFYEEMTGFTDERKEENVVCSEDVVCSESSFVPKYLQKLFLLQKPFSCCPPHPLLVPAPAELQLF